MKSPAGRLSRKIISASKSEARIYERARARRNEKCTIARALRQARGPSLGFKMTRYTLIANTRIGNSHMRTHTRTGIYVCACNAAGPRARMQPANEFARARACSFGLCTCNAPRSAPRVCGCSVLGWVARINFRLTPFFRIFFLIIKWVHVEKCSNY